MNSKFGYHTDEKSDVHRLPFVNIDKNAKDPRRRVNFFDVPTTGDYAADNEIGTLCAAAFLKFLRERPDEYGCCLQNIVLSLIPQLSDDSKNGAIIGFFWQLELSLRLHAKVDKQLDGISEGEIEDLVNALLDRHEGAQFIVEVERRHRFGGYDLTPGDSVIIDSAAKPEFGDIVLTQNQRLVTWPVSTEIIGVVIEHRRTFR